MVSRFRRLIVHRQSTRVAAISVAVLLAGGILIGLIAVNAATPESKVVQRATSSANYYATERARFSNAPAKQEIIDKDATHVAGVVLTPPHPIPTHDPHATFPPLPTPIYLTGIIASVENPYRRGQVAVNQWHDFVNGKHIGVYATSLYGDYDQGAVGVSTADRDGTHDTYQEYPTPTKHGPVQITAVNGTHFTLQAKDGTVFVFDLATRTFG